MNRMTVLELRILKAGGGSRHLQLETRHDNRMDTLMPNTPEDMTSSKIWRKRQVGNDENEEDDDGVRDR
jgi:hypothetical protein